MGWGVGFVCTLFLAIDLHEIGICGHVHKLHRVQLVLLSM